MTYEVTIPTFNSEMALWKQVVHGVNWLLRGKGAGTTPDAHALGFLRSAPDVDVPDIQVHVTPAGYLVEGEGDLVLKENSFTTVVSVCRPRSRGRIRLKSADPARSEEHTSELQSLMRISYAVFGLKNRHKQNNITQRNDSN